MQQCRPIQFFANDHQQMIEHDPARQVTKLRSCPWPLVSCPSLTAVRWSPAACWLHHTPFRLRASPRWGSARHVSRETSCRRGAKCRRSMRQRGGPTTGRMCRCAGLAPLLRATRLRSLRAPRTVEAAEALHGSAEAKQSRSARCPRSCLGQRRPRRGGASLALRQPITCGPEIAQRRETASGAPCPASAAPRALCVYFGCRSKFKVTAAVWLT
jgi:hypothetical protein